MTTTPSRDEAAVEPQEPREPQEATGLEERFWELAQDLLVLPDVTRSTMMGRPCLRVGGAYIASWERRSGAMIVKLDEATVDALIDAGRAEPFAPAGRRFREWAAIPPALVDSWPERLGEAHRRAATAKDG
ncbi:MAG: hypothetical protein S0880_15045 [Actinomycetota bacterium]|nr:hypothetical protein [Actinomycetota bacterium]